MTIKQLCIFALIILEVLLGVFLFDSYQLISLLVFCILLFLAVRSLPGSAPINFKPEDRIDICFLIVLSICASILYLCTITDSIYYIWGDEGNALITARAIRDQFKTEVFWGKGIYNEHPILGSNISAIFLLVFGDSITSVRASVMIPSLMSLFPLFYLLKQQFNRLIGWVGALMFVSGYYHYQFSHLSYNNLWLVPCIAWTLWFVYAGIEKNSSRLLFIGGVLGGISPLFTYQAVVIPVSLFVILLVWKIKCRKLNFKELHLFSGLIIGLSPFILTLKSHLFTVFSEHLKTDNVGSSLSIAQEAFDKLKTALLAPSYPEIHTHFIEGTLFDPISSCLYVLGIFVLLSMLFSSKHQLFVVGILSLFSGFSIMNIASPYAAPSPTRFTYLCILVPIISSSVLWLISLLPRKIGAFSALILVSICMWMNVSKVLIYREIISPKYVAEWKLWKEAADMPKAVVILPNNFKETWQMVSSAYNFSPSVTVWLADEANKINNIETPAFPEAVFFVKSSIENSRIIASNIANRISGTVKEIRPHETGDIDYYRIDRGIK